ncbi:MAG: hypothetical protein EA389_02950 [Ilumatobacter sp.]|nr:MAG: hypothetical protein EA389_02950 [Ilumatobacter sp.]
MRLTLRPPRSRERWSHRSRRSVWPRLPTCGSNPYCADGLARVYGIDVSDLLVQAAPGAPIAAAVRDGAADVGILFSDHPELSATDLVVLEDGLAMVAAESIVPWASAALVDERGAGLRETLDEISASLFETELRFALAAVREAISPEGAAASFTAAVGGTAREVSGDRPVRIGAEALAETPAPSRRARADPRPLLGGGFTFIPIPGCRGRFGTSLVVGKHAHRRSSSFPGDFRGNHA